MNTAGTLVFRQRGEILLLAGLLAWCAAFAPYFPMLWQTGQFYIGPVALLLILWSMWRARDVATSIPRRALSLILLLIALGALYCSSLQTVTMAHRIFPPSLGAEVIADKDWALTVATWLVSAVIWVFWLRSWTAWPKARCYAWGAVVFVAHSAVFLGFWAILQTGTPRNVCPAFRTPALSLTIESPQTPAQIFRLS
jgi:hypothetical protein